MGGRKIFGFQEVKRKKVGMLANDRDLCVQ